MILNKQFIQGCVYDKVIFYRGIDKIQFVLVIDDAKITPKERISIITLNTNCFYIEKALEDWRDRYKFYIRRRGDSYDDVTFYAEKTLECPTKLEFENYINQLKYNVKDKTMTDDWKKCLSNINLLSTISKIYFNKAKGVTTVLWDDGYKTIVKLHKGEKWSKETAVAYAIAKRYAGSGRAFTKLIEEKGIDIIKKERKNEKKKK